MRDRQGEVVANYAGNVAVWLDASSFAYQDREHVRQSFIGTIFGSDPVPADVGFSISTAVSNWRGEVAGARVTGEDWPDRRYDYSVWSREGTSRERDGYPVAWSPDGGKLAVIHPFGPHTSPEGWVSVVDWPGLGDVFTDEPPYGAGNIVFDPTSGHLAYWTSEGAGDDLATFVRLVALDTGEVVDLPRDLIGNAYWTTDGLLAIVREDMALDVYDPGGQLVESTSVPALGFESSWDFTTQAFWDPYVPTQLTVVSRDVTSTYDLPDVDLHFVHLAPDGSAVIVTSDDSAYLLEL